MQFNEVEFRVKLETLLYQYSSNQGLSSDGLKAFTNDVTNYAESLFGPHSIIICPFCQRPEYIWKLTIYVSPDVHRYNCQFDFHYDIPMIRTEEKLA